MEPQGAKKALRKEIIALLNNIPPGVRKEKSEKITSNLISTSQWNTADIILIFLSFGTEVNTDDMVLKALKEEKIVAIPRVDGKTMIFHRISNLDSVMPGKVFGIREPDPRLPVIYPGELHNTLIITPGLAFDKEKNRLGRGGGYYDAFIRDLRRMKENHNLFVGICFFEQLVATIPVCSYDMKVDMIVNDRGILR
ncbi:MAG: 5-formyltetrahydrofolate cyclo-ligase [Spirochaetales bacterium]|nr:5-formyltetrahydrofolate cyclo-ligase [Spirochaetales bacterium]